MSVGPGTRLRNWLLRVLVTFLLLLALSFTGLRALVNGAPQFRAQIETVLSETLERPLRLGGLRAEWTGLNPSVLLEEVRFEPEPGESPLTLPELELEISLWQSLKTFSLRPAEIAVSGLDITLRRESAERFSIQALGQRRVLGQRRLNLPAALRVNDARLHYIDTVIGRELRLDDFNFRLTRDGDWNQAAMTGRPVGDEAQVVRLFTHWDPEGGPGQALRLHAELRQASLPVLQDWLPEELRPEITASAGQGDIALWLELDQGRPRSVAGELDLRDLRLARAERATDLPPLQGRFDWQREAEGWRLQAAIGDDSGLQLRQDEQGIRLALDRLNLADWRGLAALLAESAPRDWLTRAAPAGELRDLRLQLDGTSPLVFQASGQFNGLALAAVGKQPGISGLSGSFRADENGGRMSLQGRNGAVRLPWLFREALPFTALATQLHWWRDARGWELSAPALELSNDDAYLQARLRAHGRPGDTPFIDVRARLRDADGKATSRYLPVGIMPDALVSWLDRAVVSGDGRQGDLIFHGPAKAFPFRDGGGVFQIRARVENGVLDYWPGWSPLTDMNADLYFDGQGMRIQSEGARMLGAPVAAGEAWVDDWFTGPLRISGQTEAEAEDLLAFLRASPLADGLDDWLAQLRGQGRHGLRLGLTIPLYEDTGPRVEGELTLRDGTVEWPARGLRLAAVNGPLRFDSDGLYSDGVQARWAGQALRLRANTEGRGDAARIRLDTRLRLRPEQLPDVPLADRLRGQSDWRLLAYLPGFDSAAAPGVNLTLESGLRGLAVDLPEPLAKTAEQNVPLRLQTRIDAQGLQPVYLRYGSRLRAVGEWRGERLRRATVSLGNAVPLLPPEPGLRLGGQGGALNLDGWYALLDDFTGGEAEGAAWPTPRWADLQLDELAVLGQRFADQQLRAERGGEGWTVLLQGPELSGRLQLPARESRAMVVDLQRLHLATDERTTAPSLGESPAGFPPMEVAVDELNLDEMRLGAMFFTARPTAEGLSLDGLRLHNPAFTLSGDLRWLAGEGGGRSELALNLQAADMGRALTRLGYVQSIEEGTGSGEIRLAWPGGPAAVAVPALDGTVSLRIDDGRIPEVDPGAGRLFSLLSITALPRRLALDFSDLFGEGFAFDRMQGSLRIVDGQARTDDFFIDGSAARLEFEGRIGLAEQDFDQLVTVMPRFSSTLPIVGGIAGGPVGAAVAYAAERLLRGEIDRLTRYHYRVTGPWADPEVQRISRQRARERSPEDAEQ